VTRGLFIHLDVFQAGVVPQSSGIQDVTPAAFTPAFSGWASVALRLSYALIGGRRNVHPGTVRELLCSPIQSLAVVHRDL